jgi:hypothetical protein
MVSFLTLKRQSSLLMFRRCVMEFLLWHHSHLFCVGMQFIWILVTRLEIQHLLTFFNEVGTLASYENKIRKLHSTLEYTRVFKLVLWFCSSLWSDVRLLSILVQIHCRRHDYGTDVILHIHKYFSLHFFKYKLRPIPNRKNCK